MTDIIQDTLTRLESISQPIIEGEGLKLYDIEYKRENIGWVVRFYIFRKDGGASIDDCARVSRQLNVLLDVEDIIKHPYYLEVSSPGLTRSLKKMRHFENSTGMIAKVNTREFIDNKRSFKGIIKSVENGNIVLEEAQKEILIPFDIISSAKLDIEI